jgi:hypothetical protein
MKLTGIHKIMPPVPADSGMHDVFIHPVKELTGQDPTAPIYIRKMKVYLWGVAAYGGSFCGFASVQKYLPANVWIGAIGIALARMGGGLVPMDEIDFGSNSLELLPDEKLIIEQMCVTGQTSFQPVIDVYWTDTP